ncbi:MAG: glycosyl hydrolase family 95 catalytic domain-containing protein, partial [Saccharofermentanales bacterium]
MIFDGTGLAQRHKIVFDGPATDFFEGALLGNGHMGAVVNTRPDAVIIHLGHNSVWDIRVDESNKDKYGTFKQAYEKLKSIDLSKKYFYEDEWYVEYDKLTQESYMKKYPRPFPCGSIYLFFDPRKYELLNYSIDISSSLLAISFEDRTGNGFVCRIFVSAKIDDADRIHIRCSDCSGNTINLFNRIRMIPDQDTASGIPLFETLQDEDSIGFRQRLPFSVQAPEIETEKDKGFLTYIKSGLFSGKNPGDLEFHISDKNEFEITVNLLNGKYDRLDESLLKHVESQEDNANDFDNEFKRTAKKMEDYWNRSGIQIDDSFLEQIWYYNTYFLHCILDKDSTCPGIFGNFMFKETGTAWHGDYHFNYNIQQPFWSCLITNHAEQNIPYVKLIEFLMPLSRKWAKEYFELDGAYFPHSAYPVEMTTFPYPTTHWGWQICEVPWAVQSLWWHYTYTSDIDMLRDRLFDPIKQATLFLVNYMMRPEAAGDNWGDDRYHVYPTFVPELYPFEIDPVKHCDCIVDLTLIKFIFNAFMEAVKILDIGETESGIVSKCELILSRYPEYPTYGETGNDVFVNVWGEDTEIVQNTPNTPMPVFPGEEISFGDDDYKYEKAVRTWKMHRNEGGNELVFKNLQGARLGILDLEAFKRQVKYCMMPNKTCADKVLLVGGRYSDETDFNYMSRMGVWTENFSLPAVV